MKKPKAKWLHLLGFHAVISLALGVVFGMLLGGLFQALPIGLLIAVLVFVASTLTALLWHRLRRNAKWNYLEGMAWALVVFGLALVPFLLVLAAANGNAGLDFPEALWLALQFCAPVLLLAAFVPLGWKRIFEA
jgi:Kef-type K+ transport system membrane component KefB